MVDYGLVSRTINNLSNTVGRATDRRYAHEEDMSRLGLAGAKFDFDTKMQNFKNDAAVASAKQNAFLDEEVTGRQAILSHPKWSDEQKQKFLKIVPDEILDGQAFKRRDWVKGVSEATANLKKSQDTSKYRQGMLGLAMDRVDATREKNQRGSTADRKYKDSVSLQNLMGRFGVKEGLDGGLQSSPMTPQQAAAMKAEANRMGLNVYFDQGTIEDVGSKLNPFDNKDVPAFTVRAIAPTGVAPGNLGLAGGRQNIAEIDEQKFKQWYYQWADKTGINQNPDDPRHHYDYGIDTKTGKPGGGDSAFSDLLNRAKTGGVNQEANTPKKQNQPDKPKIIQRGNKWFRVTQQGEEELTPEEIKELQSKSKVSQFFGNLLDGTGNKDPRFNRSIGTHQPRQRTY